METFNIILANFSQVVGVFLFMIGSVMTITLLFCVICTEDGKYNIFKRPLKYGGIVLLILSILYILTNNVQL